MRFQRLDIVIAAVAAAVFLSAGCRRPAEHFPSLPEPLPLKDVIVKGPGGIQLSKVLEGRQVALVFFGYTRCPAICPDTLKRLGRALSVLPAEQQGKVALVFVSVDTERDSPAAAEEFAHRFYADMISVTGSAEDIQALAAACGIYAGARGTEIDHSTSILWLEKGPALRKTIPHAFSPDDLADDLRLALR
ncbi:MAG: SCO family protein [Spirochaetia bacterium]|nr:SCO family protein [Spirochaetia bacterium]